MEGEIVGTEQTTSSAHLSIAGITKISSVLNTDIPLLYTRSTTNSSYMFDRTVPMFICQYEQCKKFFKSRQKIERHMLTHTGEKPFNCRFCCYRSSRKDQIKVHEFSRHYDELKRISLWQSIVTMTYFQVDYKNWHGHVYIIRFQVDYKNWHAHVFIFTYYKWITRMRMGMFIYLLASSGLQELELRCLYFYFKWITIIGTVMFIYLFTSSGLHELERPYLYI